MEKKKDIVERAVNALKKEPVPSGPPRQVADAVAAKLAQATQDEPRQGVKEMIGPVGFAKLAAAAVFLILAGYAVARLTTPQPDAKQLHAALETSLRSSLEPAIRRKVVNELNQQWQMALAGSYVRLKDEITEQYRHDLNESALRILAASGAVTNQRLTELVDAIDAAQTHERRWFTAALGQIELNRLRDKSQFVNGLETLAVETGDELIRTRQDMVRLLTYDGSEDLLPGTFESINNPN